MPLEPVVVTPMRDAIQKKYDAINIDTAARENNCGDERTTPGYTGSG